MIVIRAEYGVQSWLSAITQRARLLHWLQIHLFAPCHVSAACRSQSSMATPDALGRRESISISSRDFCLVSWKRKKITGKEMQISESSANAHRYTNTQEEKNLLHATKTK